MRIYIHGVHAQRALAQADYVVTRYRNGGWRITDVRGQRAIGTVETLARVTSLIHSHEQAVAAFTR